MKKTKILMSAMLITTVLLSIGFQGVVDAAVSGGNSLVNYKYDNTAVVGPGGNTTARISEDGNIAVWTASGGGGYINGDTSTGLNIYKRDMRTGDTSIVNLSYTGESKPTGSYGSELFAMSRTARYIAFTTNHSNVVESPAITSTDRSHLFLRDTVQNTTKLVDVNSYGVPANIPAVAAVTPISVSDDGRFVTFKARANNLLDAGNPSTVSEYSYVKDMHTGEVINPAVNSSGSRANDAANVIGTSCDGTQLVMNSKATNLTSEDNGSMNAYLVDLRNGHKITNLTFSANSDISALNISCNGRYILLSSKATNLTVDSVDGTISHYFRLDKLHGTYELIDKSTSGYVSSSSPTWRSSISDNGRVVYYSTDKNLVSPASVKYLELYMRDPEAGTNEIIPINSSGDERGLSDSNTNVTTDLLRHVELSGRGDYVIYLSGASSLVPGIGSTSGKKIIRSKVE